MFDNFGSFLFILILITSTTLVHLYHNANHNHAALEPYRLSSGLVDILPYTNYFCAQQGQ